jgi:exosortase
MPLQVKAAEERTLPSRMDYASFATVLAALAWSYWPALGAMARKWSSDPQYSHGYIVPIFAAILLYWRRDTLPDTTRRWRVGGLGLMLLSLAARLVGAYFYFESLDFISLIGSLSGAVLLCFGGPVIAWSLPAVLFLAFMIPMPHTVETTLRAPLRKFGTTAATFVIQAMGFNAFPQGNVITMDHGEVGIAEACSGLRMLMVFFALSTAVAIVWQRPLWERLIIVVSAVPIALISNLARIVATAMLLELVGSEAAEKFFHDVAGWLMMPLGLVLLGLETMFLKRLIIIEQEIPLRPTVAGAQATAQRTKPPGVSIVGLSPPPPRRTEAT